MNNKNNNMDEKYICLKKDIGLQSIFNIIIIISLHEKKVKLNFQKC